MIQPLQFGLKGGLACGLMMMLLTLCSLYSGYGWEGLSAISNVYPGYTVSFSGAFVGMFYTFMHGFLSLYFAAHLYNKFTKEWTT